MLPSALPTVPSGWSAFAMVAKCTSSGAGKRTAGRVESSPNQATAMSGWKNSSSLPATIRMGSESRATYASGSTIPKSASAAGVSRLHMNSFSM